MSPLATGSGPVTTIVLAAWAHAARNLLTSPRASA